MLQLSRGAFSELPSSGARTSLLTAVVCVFRPIPSPPPQAVGPLWQQLPRLFHGAQLRMAGHSHWAKIKRKKGAAEVERSKAIAKVTSKVITAIQLGGSPDPEKNLQLSSVISQAKSMGIPKATLENAIRSGSRSSSGDGGKPIIIEGRGPQGYLILIEAFTNKSTRTRQELKVILEKHGGGLGEPGSSSYVFEHKGIVQIPREDLTGLPSCDDPLELAIEVGAEDVLEDEEDTGHVLLKTEPSETRGVVEAVKKKGLTVSSATLEYLPKTLVGLSPQACEKAEKLLEVLSQNNDVVEVHSNFVPETPP